jgi:broad specificity phosphatase PhoE
MTTLYIVRHGETDWNQQKRIQGHTDIPLNAQGFDQASILKQTLAEVTFDAVFSSDLIRAKQTAEVLTHPSPLSIQYTPLLRERSFGTLEGKYTHEIDAAFCQALPYMSQLERTAYLAYAWHPTVETAATVHERFQQFLQLYLHSLAYKTVLIVTHGGFIRMLLDYYADFHPEAKWMIENCGMVQFQMNDNHLQLIAFQGIFRHVFTIT